MSEPDLAESLAVLAVAVSRKLGDDLRQAGMDADVVVLVHFPDTDGCTIGASSVSEELPTAREAIRHTLELAYEKVLRGPPDGEYPRAR